MTSTLHSKRLQKIAVFACGILLIAAFFAPADSKFVKPQAIDFKSLLSAPPAEGSEQTKLELEQMLALQAHRTPEEVARAQSEVDLTAFAFSQTLGSWFNPDDLPETAKLFKQVFVDTKAIVDPSKEFYGRKRPPLVDSRIQPCVPLEKSASFPSGHSTRAMVTGLILAHMFPDKRDVILAQAHQIGDDRVLGGMHFPSDVEGGRVLGTAIANAMLADPDFQSEMEKAKEECLAKMPK